MKKQFLVIAAIVAGLGFTSCSVDTSGLEDAADDLEQQLEDASDKMDEEVKDAEDQSETTSTVMYQCPEDCENGPAYFKEGPCKKCGKDMVVI